MKCKILNICLISLFSFYSLNAQTSADSTGYDGDHFSLEGALELFKEAKSLEDFEKALNDKDKNVNNLDLNEDDQVDYIRVIDQVEGDVHAIVLQASLGEKESQDVAVIGIEKNGPENAILQIIGDEDVFGEETIVEPFEENDKAPGKGGPSADLDFEEYVVVNVWLWPSVRFLYAPGYVVYVSPWRWGVYPSYWRVWRPLPWARYHRARYHYNHRFRICSTRRVVRARSVYRPHRVRSVRVTTRTTTRAKYNKTVRRTTVKPAKKANKAKAKKRAKTTKRARAKRRN